jgi:hypothetical protein
MWMGGTDLCVLAGGSETYFNVKDLLLSAASKCVQGVMMCGNGMNSQPVTRWGVSRSLYAEDGRPGGQEV